MYQSPLFENVLAKESSPAAADYARILEAQYAISRKKTALLLERIPQDNPWLTVHNISHIDAMWECVEILLGSDVVDLSMYSLNPLELFILGASFLIHDTALSSLAFPGGLTELRCSP